jgi:hypothetical protein
VEVDRAVAETHLAIAVLPREGVLEPVPVVTLRKILSGMGPSALGPE